MLIAQFDLHNQFQNVLKWIHGCGVACTATTTTPSAPSHVPCDCVATCIAATTGSRGDCRCRCRLCIKQSTIFVQPTDRAATDRAASRARNLERPTLRGLPPKTRTGSRQCTLEDSFRSAWGGILDRIERKACCVVVPNILHMKNNPNCMKAQVSDTTHSPY